MSALLLVIGALLVPGRFDESDRNTYWLLGTGLVGVVLEDPDGDHHLDGAGLAVELMRIHDRKHACLIPGYGVYAEGRLGLRGADGAIGVRAFITGIGLDIGALVTAEGVGRRVGGLLWIGPLFYRGAVDFVGDREIITLSLTLQMQWYFADGGIYWILDPPRERRPAR